MIELFWTLIYTVYINQRIVSSLAIIFLSEMNYRHKTNNTELVKFSCGTDVSHQTHGM